MYDVLDRQRVNASTLAQSGAVTGPAGHYLHNVVACCHTWINYMSIYVQDGWGFSKSTKSYLCI